MSTPNVDVNFRATGLEGVQRGLKLVKDQAEPTGRQWGTASRQIAAGLEQVARSGKVTGESLKQIISSGSEMAFQFGKGGPIVAALAIVGVAIYEHITGRMKEAQEEAKKTAQEIGQIANAGGVSQLREKARIVLYGTPFDKEGNMNGVSSRVAGAFKGSLADMEAEFAELQAKIPKDAAMAAGETAKRWNELVPELNKARDAFRQLQIAANNVASQPAGNVGTLPAMTSSASGPGGSTSSKSTSALVNRYVIGAPGGPTRFLNEILGSKSSLHGQDPLNVAIHGKGRPQDNPMTVAMVEGMKQAGEIAGNGFVDTLASTIEAGVSRVFQKGANIGTVFAAIGQAALSGLGSVAIQIGKQALVTMAFIERIRLAIASWNPAIGVAAAIGLIALGSAMGGAGSRMGGGGGGGGGYGGGYGASSGYGSTVIDRGMIDPTRGAGVSASRPMVFSPTIIGVRDPVVMRELEELFRNATARGGLG